MAVQYSKIYLHFDYPVIMSYIIMTSLQHRILLLQSSDSYGKFIDNNALNRLQFWTRLSAIKSKEDYQTIYLQSSMLMTFAFLQVIV